MTHYYGMRLRGCAPMCQPKGFTRLDDTTGRYHDLLAYDHRLTDEETAAYELDYLGTELYNSTINTSVNEEEFTMPLSEEQVKRKMQRDIKWASTHVTQFKMGLVDTTDADIIAWLNAQPNKQGYIKSLIRADMARQEKKEEE